VENKTGNIKKLKDEKKKLEKMNTELKLQNEQNIKEIEYLINQNKKLKNEQNNVNQLESDKLSTIEVKDNNVDIEYYEKQLNDSNNTIKRMGDMIKELEKQIEELQKEIEENNYQERKKYDNNKELLDIIKQKDKEIKQYKIQLELISEEKNKLYEDNTKMYNDLDRFQKYILNLSEQNKKLSFKINQYTNNNNNNDNKIISMLYKKKEKDLKNMSGDGIEDIKNTLDIKTIVNNNYDDISQNNFTSLNFDTLLKSTNNINKNDDNKKFNGSTDNELNENQNNQKIYENNYKNKSHSKLKNNKHKEKVNDIDNSDIQDLNKVDLYFNYESKDNEELSD